LGKFQEAILFLDEISTNYGYETLADDALYQAAMIEMKYLKNPVRAMELYEKIIFTYPGSVYTVDARKKIRELRGDDIE
jgi:TolA-binding protein